LTDEFVWPVRVYYEDTDSAGVVYYANYLKFLERARSEWLRARGLEQDSLREQQGIVFVVRSLQLDFRVPARFNDLLAVHSRIQEQRGASLVFAQRILRGSTLLLDGLVRVACIGADGFRPRALPHVLQQQLPVGGGQS